MSGCLLECRHHKQSFLSWIKSMLLFSWWQVSLVVRRIIDWCWTTQMKRMLFTNDGIFTWRNNHPLLIMTVSPKTNEEFLVFKIVSIITGEPQLNDVIFQKYLFSLHNQDAQYILLCHTSTDKSVLDLIASCLQDPCPILYLAFLCIRTIFPFILSLLIQTLAWKRQEFPNRMRANWVGI